MPMTDYDLLLDDEIKAFVAQTLQWYPADTFAQSVAENRATYDAMCRAFFAGYPESIAARDAKVAGVPTRQYRTKQARSGPLVVYLHGGGLMLGGLDSHDDVCAEIAETSGLPVWAVDYRLCPENTRLDAVQDAGLVLAAARKSSKAGVILVGDSAGGWLAGALARRNRDAPDILGQILIYPGLGGAMNKPSMTRHAQAPLLSADELGAYALDAEKCTIAPLTDPNFSGLPSTLVLSAECDPLADDGPLYADAIRRAGGQALAIVEPGLVHGHLRARHMSKRARRSFERVNQAIAQLANDGRLDAAILTA